MSEDKELTIELIRSIDKRNKLMESALKWVGSLIILMLLLFTVILCTTVISYNETLSECTRLYFETDYSDTFPSNNIEQSVDIRSEK